MSQFKWGPSSLERRETLCPKLKEIVDLALKMSDRDFSIICGYRGMEEQEAAYNAKNSNAHFGESYHNFCPSLAVDVAPWPVDYTDEEAFEELARVMLNAADALGYALKWLGDFRVRSGGRDLGHFELII